MKIDAEYGRPSSHIEFIAKIVIQTSISSLKPNPWLPLKQFYDFIWTA